MDKSICPLREQSRHSSLQMMCYKMASKKVFPKLLSQSLNTQNKYFKYSNNMTLLYSKKSSW